MVLFADLTKRFGALAVLDDLNLDVVQDKRVSVIGPAGSGKMTVLWMSMPERIKRGAIHLEGQPLTREIGGRKLVPAFKKYLRKPREPIGTCFRHFNLFPHMTALQNCMEGPVQVLGTSKQDARMR